ncbi:hypothetical protein LJF28_04925 [Chryseobacterium indologenes]|uniref:hypothetical protein n=1 Tax=Chryseobacterium indologenes TaxID=253 RepID=UPI001D0D2717|nr:hypothetical protein [Chryseobacterium indologenes]UDQ55013.1 hypothetical protein LJF28_04925 [Chryseobacterium indologenes]
MVKINGYWYNHDEIVEALEKKGYTIIRDEELPDRRGNVKIEWYAIKNGEEISVLNTLKSVAVKEFHKKPLLM